MINGVHLINFANHRDTRLFFPRLAALVGENGAGKTTRMRAVQEASRLMQQQQTAGELLPEPPSVPIRSQFLRIGTRDMSIGLSGPGTRKGQSGQWGIRAESDMRTSAGKSTARLSGM